MRRTRLIAVAVLSVTAMPCLLLPALANAQIHKTRGRDPLRIAIIRQVEFLDGAGCGLRFAANRDKTGERYVFLSDYGGNALMNINGKDTRLKLVSRREHEGKPKKGDQSKWNYAAPGVKVCVAFVVTGVCRPDDESCEVTYYDATLTVTSGSRKSIVKAKGLCGS